MLKKGLALVTDALRGARQVPDLMALTALAPLGVRYAPWTRMSIRPRAMQAIATHLATHRPPVVVELGAGVSTLYMAAIVRRWGGTVYSVEHDAAWRAAMAGMVADEGLDAAVRILACPLTPAPDPESGAPWYDLAPLRAALGEAPIGFLLVDGPPAFEAGKALARLPALQALRTSLAPDATIYLDDVDRPGEREVLRRWAAAIGVDDGRTVRVDRGAFLALGGAASVVIG